MMLTDLAVQCLSSSSVDVDITCLYHVSVCRVLVKVSGPVSQTSFKTVKATDFIFDMHVPRNSPDMTSLKFLQKGRGRDHVTP